MTNEITLTKQELALDLQAQGINVTDFLAERIIPPVVIINPTSPYLVRATVQNEFLMSLELVCVAATATNKQAIEKLDELIAQVLEALPGYAKLDNVASPYEWAVNNASYLATTIQINVLLTI